MIFKRENPFLLKAFHSGWMERPAWSVSIVYVLGLTLLPLFNSWQIKLKLSFARSAQTRLHSEVECAMGNARKDGINPHLHSPVRKLFYIIKNKHGGGDCFSRGKGCERSSGKKCQVNYFPALLPNPRCTKSAQWPWDE